MKSNGLIVYTALTGRYERLQEQPLSAVSNARFVCYTDDPNLTSQSWEVKYIKPSMPWDSTRTARSLKILGTDETRSAGTSLWIDNRVVLRQRPEDLLDYVSIVRGDWEIALPLHSYRKTVADEFSVILKAAYDSPARVREQLHRLASSDPEVLNERPYWTAIIARRNSESISSSMRTWHEMVMCHSRRDQLSINYALRFSRPRVAAVPLNNFGSEYHEWVPADLLPKDTQILFSRDYRYGFGRDMADRALSNRFVVNVRGRLDGVLDRRLNRLRK